MPAKILVGTDIADVFRIEKLIKNKRFLTRVFTPAEIRYCREKKFAAQHFAVRFAAKEAVWKALNPGAKKLGISHREIGVRRADTGQPSVEFSKRLKKYESKFSLSLSHTKDYAVAVAIYCP